MLYKIAFNNIKKSFRDYIIYFLTLMFAVAVFYMFNSLDGQVAMMTLDESGYEEASLLMRVLYIVSVFVSIVMGFLITFANAFLMKRRKKEFGVYLVLGMSKVNVSGILLWETLLIGIVSLGAGLALGIFGSQFMSYFTANMFKADMGSFRFVFSAGALARTCLYYGIMFVAVMILNVVMVSGIRLISLFQARSRTEKKVMRSGTVSIPVFAASCAALIWSYYRLSGGIRGFGSLGEFTVCIIILSAATFFLIWSLSGILLKIAVNVKGFWYKGSNMFVLRRLSAKINTAAVSVTVICLMLFFTIVSLSGSLSLKNVIEKNIEKNVPVDLTVWFEDTGSGKRGIDILKEEGISEDELENVTEVYEYNIDGFTTRDFLGDVEVSEKTMEKLPNIGTSEIFVTLSEYNRLAEVYGNETFTLEDDEYVCIANFRDMVELRNKALSDGNPVKIGGREYHSKYTECRPGFMELSVGDVNTGFIVLPDNCGLGPSDVFRCFMAADYSGATEAERRATEEKIYSMTPDAWFYETKSEIYHAYMGLTMIAVFVAVYTGVTFLIAGAALLSLNMLTDSEDGRCSYDILRKTGCEESFINRAVFRHTGLFFILPLALAILHSVFGLRLFMSIFVGISTDSSFMLSVVITTLIIVGIYGAYFAATYAGSRRIIGTAH